MGTSSLPWIIAASASVLAIVATLLATRKRGVSAQDVTDLRREMQTMLTTQAQTFTGQLTQMTQAVNQQLGQVNASLQKGAADSGLLVSRAQETVAGELRHSQEVLTRINQQLGELQQSGRDLASASQTLQNVLGGAKTRGSLGEIALEGLLTDALPAAAYEMQFRFATGQVVDAIVRSGENLLCIDSKFPLESYRRMADGAENARREFASAVRKHADSIAEKYILPAQRTLDFALMFVPSEGVYYELLMTEDAKYGRLDEYCRSQKVLPVSPNTCYAYLCAIATSHRGMKVEENARKLLSGLGGLQKQLEAFSETYEKLGNQLRWAQQNYEDADGKLTRARGALEQMAQGVLPEAPATQATLALEPARND